ncbi:MAG: hypothetical protein A2138_01715 [Deltaproteobacteria bacterium RBG_16_71_12]|nr:MAG: hypothetical protein A2138_01715 [Deltaproteobacteria bacterium RBG_16_71_12]
MRSAFRLIGHALAAGAAVAIPGCDERCELPEPPVVDCTVEARGFGAATLVDAFIDMGVGDIRPSFIRMPFECSISVQVDGLYVAASEEELQALIGCSDGRPSSVDFAVHRVALVVEDNKLVNDWHVSFVVEQDGVVTVGTEATQTCSFGDQWAALLLPQASSTVQVDACVHPKNEGPCCCTRVVCDPEPRYDCGYCF